MKMFIVYAHPERKSFNGALLRRGCETLTAWGHEVQISDLYAMQFNPVSDRRIFLQRKDPHMAFPPLDAYDETLRLKRNL